MKRIISFVLILMLAAMAIGCDKLPEEPPSVSPSPTESQTETPTEAPADTPVLPVLSEMSEKDCINKLRELGADIPEDLQFDIRGMVRDFEEDIDRPYPGDVYFDDEYALFESVRAAVRAYYAESGFPEHEPTDEPTGEPAGTPAPTAVPEADVPKVYAGSDVFFVSYPDGTVYGWGRNDFGQLGIGSTEDKRMPVFVSNGMIPVTVGETVFALSADNILWGWGRNDGGQLGMGNTDEALRPVELMHFVKGVYRSYGCVYVLTEIGDLYRLGAGSEAELVFEDVESFFGDCLIRKGGELWISSPEWIKKADGVSRAFDRWGNFVERSDGMLCCVNYNGDFEPICGDVLQVEIADNTAYILKTDGSLWSYAREGVFHEVPDDQLEKLVHIMDGVAEISCGWEMDEDWGYSYHFALKTNGELWSWGPSFSNALVGKAEDNESRDPECVASGVRAFFTNGAQTFIVTYDGRVLATGSGMEFDFSHCPLGDGTEETRYGFVDLGLKNICTVFTHLEVEYIDYDDGTDGVQLYSRTYAVDSDGRIFAWGWNGDGLLGVDSEDENVLSPVEVFLTK